MLDLSIKQLRAKYKTVEQLLQFLQTPSITEAKTDGVKLTLIKVKDEGNLNDWIVSYKGQLFYRGEFAYQSSVGKSLSIGNSQFDQVFDHLESLGRTSIEPNTEFLIEFVVNKDTVMSEYTKTGEMILIGYGKSQPVIRYGKVSTNCDRFISKGRERYAQELRIQTPKLLHSGMWHPTSKLISGCRDEELRRKLVDKRNILETLETKPNHYYNLVVDIFLSLESPYGGKDEGLVIETMDGLFKVQQDYQLDKEQRLNKKLQFIEDDIVKEQAYWDDVLEISKVIADSVETQDIQKGLEEIAKKIEALDVVGTHSKKNEYTIKDDIQVNAKNFFLKNLYGNNGALIIGKFRVLTKGHVRVIEQAIEECDDVVVGVVTGTRNKNTNDLRLRLVRKAFPNVQVIELFSANPYTAFKKAGININRVYAGSDRVEDYQRMLKKAPGVEIIEIDRTPEDISATKIIKRLNDRKYFRASTPRSIWMMYPEVFEAYKDHAEFTGPKE